jgi:hypothetical protein
MSSGRLICVGSGLLFFTALAFADTITQKLPNDITFKAIPFAPGAEAVY